MLDYFKLPIKILEVTNIILELKKDDKEYADFRREVDGLLSLFFAANEFYSIL